MDIDLLHDANVRQAAFEWLKQQSMRYDEVLPRRVLAQGFQYAGHRIPLVSPQGIFKPKLMQVALSITTSPKSPYADHFGSDGLLQYRYRGTNPDHPDNRSLRFAMRHSLPLAYFHGIVQGKYMAMWPVYVVGDNPPALSFSVAVDEIVQPIDLAQVAPHLDENSPARRQYITTQAKRRLHQKGFRERVLQAYQNQCALCQLRHSELLDAAHIIPDAEELGEPVVPNGISLCRLHHAAFDKFFLTIRPDLVIEVRADILRERDGPTLRHAIQGVHGQRIVLPSRKALHPSTANLEWRYAQFLELANSVDSP